MTPTGGATRTGAILGTPGYMSPEQVRGDKVDARSDIFSLRAVLYEMLSGQRPFRGGSLVETGHSILHDEPPPLERPPLVAQLVRRCLAKEPEARIQSARDLAFALEMVRSDDPRRDLPSRGRRSLLARSWWVLVLLAALAAAVGMGRRFSPHPTGPPRGERVTLRPVNFVRPARSAQTAADLGYRLYSVDLETGSVAPVSPATIEPDVLEVSLDGKLAAAWTTSEGKRYPAIFPLSGGEPLVVRDLGPDVAPSGWASNTELWLAKFDGPEPSGFELIRFDVRRGLSVERRSVPTGGGMVAASLRVTPDGKNSSSSKSGRLDTSTSFGVSPLLDEGNGQ